MLNNHERANHAILLIYISLGALSISTISTFMEYQLLNKGTYTIAEAELNDNIQMVIALIYIVIFIINAVFFIRWFRRAYANLSRLGIKTNHDDSWAFWAWGVPILAWFRPLSMMKEIWFGYVKRADTDNTELTEADKIAPNFGLWWTFYILATITGQIAFRMSNRSVTIEELINTDMVTILSNLLEFPAGLLVIMIIKKITKIEDKVYKGSKGVNTMDALVND